jgi:hypothetical protein
MLSLMLKGLNACSTMHDRTTETAQRVYLPAWEKDKAEFQSSKAGGAIWESKPRAQTDINFTTIYLFKAWFKSSAVIVQQQHDQDDSMILNSKTA